MGLEAELKKIGTFFVTQITTELAKKDKKASGKLLKSINSKIETSNSGFEIAVFAEAYFKFVDRGVNGRNRNRGSQYSFRSKKPPLEPLLQWVKTKSLESGDKSALSAAYAIQNHIWRNGIEGINFLDEFLEKHTDEQLDKIGDVLMIDISAKLDKII
jgi:hypothetical protein